MKFLNPIYVAHKAGSTIVFALLFSGSFLQAAAEAESKDSATQRLLGTAAQKSHVFMNSLRQVFSCFCPNVQIAESETADDYRVYTFGEDQTVLQQDMEDLLSIFNRDDERLCTKADFDLLFPDNSFTITGEYIEQASRTKRLLADFTFKCDCPENCPPIDETDDFYTRADIFIIRDAMNNFIALGIVGVGPKNWADETEDERELVTDYVLFVAPKFRGKGYAKILVQHIKNHLLNMGITEISFHAKKDNPACAWYDRFGFTKKEDLFEDGEPTGLYEYSGEISAKLQN